MKNTIVDSGCDICEKLVQNCTELNITKVPLTLQLGDEVFIDDENFDVENYLQTTEASKLGPKTAAPSPELYLEKYKQNGDTFVVTLSSHLSGSYNSAMLAKQMLIDELIEKGEEIGSKFIHVFDSLSASAGETMVTHKIGQLVNLNFSNEEIVKKVEEYIQEMRTYFILDGFDNLAKTGRVSPYIAKLASVLSIKPICKADNGKISMMDKARGKTKAFQKLLDIMAADIESIPSKTLSITHVKCLDKAMEFQAEVMKRFNFKEIIICDATGLCSNYASRGGIILAY